MSFKVESDNLRSQAKIWSDAKTNVDEVKQTLLSTVGQGWRFGIMAGSMGVSGRYDEWTSDMDNALADASYSLGYLDAALNSTANAYDDADSTAVTRASELDKLIEENGYHHD